MKNRVPNKPAAATLAGSASIVLIWIVGQFKVELPPEVAAAFVNLFAGLAYYIAPTERD